MIDNRMGGYHIRSVTLIMSISLIAIDIVVDIMRVYFGLRRYELA